ncbi:MAG: hypothetical protein LBE71_03925 [Dysgonamonadaceae bacterium]|nr:hypothetical protein [Dysgonamonadaceae bacterium]
MTFFWIASASPLGDGVGSQSHSPVIARTKSEAIQKRKEMDCRAASRLAMTRWGGAKLATFFISLQPEFEG